MNENPCKHGTSPSEFCDTCNPPRKERRMKKTTTIAPVRVKVDAPTFPPPIDEPDLVVVRLESLAAWAEDQFRRDVLTVRVDGSDELKKSACTAVEVSRMRVERIRLAVAMARSMKS